MNRPDARALIETLAAGAQADAGGGREPEPEPEELLDYLRGELAPDDEARVSRRLVADPAAARALLELAELESAAESAAEEHLPDPETRAGWRDLETKLPKPARPPRRGWLPPWLSPALAALLLVASVGLGLRVLQLEGELRAPSALVAVEVPLGSRSTPEVVEAAPGSSLALMLPVARDGERCGELSAEIAGPGIAGRRIVDGLAADPYGLVTLHLPRVLPGRYAVALSGCGEAFGEAGFEVVTTAEGGGDG